MRELKKIKANYDGKIVDAVLLAVYTCECYTSKKTFFERLFCKKTNSKIIVSELKQYLVFIPWKHREKELVELSETDIIQSEPVLPSEWIAVPEFNSKGTEVYLPTATVKDFNGYPFIYQNNSFICDQICGEIFTNLEILYAEMPELLNEEFDEYNTDFTEKVLKYKSWHWETTGTEDSAELFGVKIFTTNFKETNVSIEYKNRTYKIYTVFIDGTERTFAMTEISNGVYDFLLYDF